MPTGWWKGKEVVEGLRQVLPLLAPSSRWERAVKEAQACCLHLPIPRGFLEASCSFLTWTKADKGGEGKLAARCGPEVTSGQQFQGASFPSPQPGCPVLAVLECRRLRKLRALAKQCESIFKSFFLSYVFLSNYTIVMEILEFLFREV